MQILPLTSMLYQKRCFDNKESKQNRFVAPICNNLNLSYPVFGNNLQIPKALLREIFIDADYKKIGSNVVSLGLKEIKNYAGEVFLKSEEDIKSLLNGLREGAVKDFQLKALEKLAQNPIFAEPQDVIKLVSQINTLERGELFMKQVEVFNETFPKLNSKELVSIIPRLTSEKLPIQKEFVRRMYLQKLTDEKVDLEDFSELLSSIEDENIAKIQLSFFEDLVFKNKVSAATALNLISSIEDKDAGVQKKYCALRLLKRGFKAEDLLILIPKVKTKELTSLYSKMADYFVGERGMDSEYAAKIMSSISSEKVFSIQKDIIEKMTKLRDYEDVDIMKILGDIQTHETAELKMAVINELSKIEKLNGHDIMHIVTNVDNVYTAEIKVKTAKNLAQIEKLTGNNIGYIVAGCHNEENSRVKCRASEELVKNDYMTGKAITSITSRLLKDETADIQISAVEELTKEKVLTPEQIATIVRGMRNSDYKEAKLERLQQLLRYPKLDNDSIVKILYRITKESKDKYLMNCIDFMCNDDRFTKEDITKIASTMWINKHNCMEFIRFFATIPPEIKEKITDYSVVQDFYPFIGKDYLNKQERHNLLLALIKHNSELFDGEKNEALRKLYPNIPRNNEEYCALLPALARTINTEPKKLSTRALKAIQIYPSLIRGLANEKSGFTSINFEDSQNVPTLTYKREDFVNDVKNIVVHLDPITQKRIYDQFSFSLEEKNGKTVMLGYPRIPGKYEQIKDNPEAEVAMIKLILAVKNFTSKNQIIINGSEELNEAMNLIFAAIPELFGMVEKKQNDYHHFDSITHTFRVMQEVIKNERFKHLSDKDKVIVLTAALMHDISKEEYVVDKAHSLNSAFDAHYIAERFNFSDADRSKLFAVIRNHEWLKYYNKENISNLQKIERAKNVAFSLREGNAFELVSILAEADLKGMKKQDEGYNLFADALKEGNSEVSRYIRDLQRTAIHLPQFKLPKASELVADGNIIRDANIGGIKNKVIYLTKNMTKGQKVFDNTEFDPSDFNVLVHALDSQKKAIIFECLDEKNSETLISASYVNLVKGNWKVFRQQGFILDVDSDNIHAAYFKDYGSGLNKTIDLLKLDYLFEGYFKPQRDYISQKIKEKLHINADSYKALYQDIKNKTLAQIREEYPFVSAAIKQIYMEMQGDEYTYGRKYNEVLVTRPKIQGVFAYDRSITQVPRYLRKYAQDKDIPVIIFLD